jgi:co-chaperonin GroES (HSP10)
MSEDTFTNLEVSTIEQSHSNELTTTVGDSVEDDINYQMPTDDFDIVEVFDDILLGEFHIEGLNKDGEKISEGGIHLTDDAKDDDINALYRVLKVQMVGENVKFAKVGHYVVVSKTAGMKIIDFNGRECAMVREPNVFMRIEPKK